MIEVLQNYFQKQNNTEAVDEAESYCSESSVTQNTLESSVTQNTLEGVLCLVKLLFLAV